MYRLSLHVLDVDNGFDEVRDAACGSPSDDMDYDDDLSCSPLAVTTVEAKSMARGMNVREREQEYVTQKDLTTQKVFARSVVRVKLL